mgnify:CR=1 FL=1
MKKAVITVIGNDTVGIIAKVSNKCFDFNANILDITQKVFSDTFCMIMMIDISNINSDFDTFVDELEKLGKEMGLAIRTMHEDIFNSMHRI